MAPSSASSTLTYPPKHKPGSLVLFEIRSDERPDTPQNAIPWWLVQISAETPAVPLTAEGTALYIYGEDTYYLHGSILIFVASHRRIIQSSTDTRYISHETDGTVRLNATDFNFTPPPWCGVTRFPCPGAGNVCARFLESNHKHGYYLRTSLIAAAGAAAELVVEDTLRLSTTLAGIAAVA